MNGSKCSRASTTVQVPSGLGFIVDNTYGGRVQSEWAEGKPQRSMWTGLKIAKDAKLPVSTYRCEKCGYLESYARFS